MLVGASHLLAKRGILTTGESGEIADRYLLSRSITYRIKQTMETNVRCSDLEQQGFDARRHYVPPRFEPREARDTGDGE